MWQIEIGQKLKRRDVHSLYGGNMQGGISTPKNSKNILIFTSLRSGAKYGYDKHEGLREDGSYAYTGQGQVGDQSLVRGNKIIFDSVSKGLTIRLFQVSATWATYAGAFTLGDPPFTEKEAKDRNGDLRKVIVFNLVPVDADVELLPEFGGGAVSKLASMSDWQSPDWSTYAISQAAKSETPLLANRVEFELEAAFGEWLKQLGHAVKNLPLKVGSTTIHPDLFDATTNTIFEAKKSSSRGHVREAIGQVLDYQNNEQIAGAERNCAILLPGRPANDLVTLCNKLDIRIFVPVEGDDYSKGFEPVV